MIAREFGAEIQLRSFEDSRDQAETQLRKLERQRHRPKPAGYDKDQWTRSESSSTWRTTRWTWRTSW